MSQDGVGPQERNKMILSRETLEGLRITGKFRFIYFVPTTFTFKISHA